jgi:hypothetical protein
MLPAVVAVALSSIPIQTGAQAGRTMKVITKGLGANGNISNMSNPADFVFGFVGIQLMSDPTSYMLFYEIFDVAGTINDFGFGSIPASSVEVSGGSIDNGKAVVKLNVDTCLVAGFTPTSGPCGVFDITWTEEPPNVAGSADIRQDSTQTFPGGGKMVTNSTARIFFATATGTALGVSQTGGPNVGSLTDGTSVSITISDPN